MISTVIPTYRRPQLVLGAVRSALNQTFVDQEIIVVIDGPDSETQEALRQFEDPRLRVIVLPKNSGGSVARNVGVEAAQGEWIAFLDDDDEWMPNKLQLQYDVATKSEAEFPLVACKAVVRSPHGEFCWPRRLPGATEDITDYILVRRTPFSGETLLQTSTFLTKRGLLSKVKFREGLRRHQDWDWVLRARRVKGFKLEYIALPLVVWRIEYRNAEWVEWRESAEWIAANKDLVSRRAYGSFMLGHVGRSAAAARDWCAFFPVLWDALRFGKVGAWDLGLYAALWFIPPTWRRRIRAAVDPSRTREAVHRDSFFR